MGGSERLNVHIPSAELAAFRAWCSEHDKTLSAVVTGLIHVFNVRQQKNEIRSVEETAARVEANAHEKNQEFHRQANSLKKQVRGEALPGADFLD